MISQILQIVLNLSFQIGKVVLYHIPNDSIIHLKIFVDNIVSHTSNQFPLLVGQWISLFVHESVKIVFRGQISNEIIWWNEMFFISLQRITYSFQD